jgi:hypothetical protein
MVDTVTVVTVPCTEMTDRRWKVTVGMVTRPYACSDSSISTVSAV